MLKANLDNWDKAYTIASGIKFKTWATDKKITLEAKDIAKVARDSVKDSLKKVLEKILIFDSKEANEDIKRKHKFWLLGVLSAFIVIQFCITFTIIDRVLDFVFTYYMENKSIDNHLIDLLFTFVTGYITSVVIELYHMLKFVAEKVFDTSITDLVKLFREEKKE